MSRAGFAFSHWIATSWRLPGTVPPAACSQSKSRISRKPNLFNEASADVSGGMLVVLALTVLALEATSNLQVRMVLDVGKADKGCGRGRGKRKEGRWRNRPATSKMTSLLAATLGHSGGVGRMESGGLGVALRCVSAKTSPS